MARIPFQRQDRAPAGSREQTGQDDLRIVRRRVRRLTDLSRSHALLHRLFVLNVRRQDQAFQQFVAPPAADASTQGPNPHLPALLEASGEALAVRSQLVRLWAAAQAERLALLQELGELPCDDWKSFYEQLRATPCRVADPGKPAPAPSAPKPPE